MRAELEFDTFYATTYPRLVRQLTLMTLDGEQAQDALQEAYVRAWQRWDRVSAYEDPEGWVRTVAYRQCVSVWRRLVTARRAAPVLASSGTVAPVASAEATVAAPDRSRLSTAEPPSPHPSSPIAPISASTAPVIPALANIDPSCG